MNGTATVAMPVDKALRFCTESFGSWWPAAYHIGQADMADAIVEPREGGRWYERGTDGSECAMHDMLEEQGGGWSTVLEVFAKAAETQS